MKKTLLTLAVVSSAALMASLSSAVTPDMDPLIVAKDTHKLLFENQFVRVLEFRVPPGAVEPMHAHDKRVVVFLTDFRARVTNQGAEPKVVERQAGGASWSDAVVHTVENIGPTEMHGISIELK